MTKIWKNPEKTEKIRKPDEIPEKKIIISHSKSVKITTVIYCFPACNCNEEGSRDVTCDDDTGKCTCKANVIGDKCDFCSPGNFGFPACQGTIPFKINHSVHNILMY